MNTARPYPALVWSRSGTTLSRRGEAALPARISDESDGPKGGAARNPRRSERNRIHILEILAMSQSRIALFIDGPNLHATTKTLGFELDYRRLLAEFWNRGTVVRAFYFTAIPGDQDCPIRPLVDWLDYNGYTVVTKPAKEFTDSLGRRRIKGRIAVELAVNAIEFAGHLDQMFLFSRDGDFRSLVESVQRRGVRVTVISTIRSTPAMIADELRRQADVFIDIEELRTTIATPGSKQCERREAACDIEPSRLQTR